MAWSEFMWVETVSFLNSHQLVVMKSLNLVEKWTPDILSSLRKWCWHPTCHNPSDVTGIVWITTWNIIVETSYGVWRQVSKFYFKEQNGDIIWWTIKFSIRRVMDISPYGRDELWVDALCGDLLFKSRNNICRTRGSWIIMKMSP
jgi:hypothetical protein